VAAEPAIPGTVNVRSGGKLFMQAIPLQQVDLIRLLQGKYARWLMLAVNLLLVVWIASLMAALTWGLLSPSTSSAPVVEVKQESPVPADPGQQLVSQLPGWHLLGQATRASAPARTASPVNAPDTTLKLELRGLLASNEPKNARAIIADPRGKEDQYAIGEKVPGNAELSEIHADRVILKRNDRYETLRLPRNKKSRRAGSGRPATAARSTQSAGQRLKAVRQQLKQKPRALASLVRAVPKQDSKGKTIGYTVSPGRDPELFKIMGLQAGDVVTMVNSIKLDNPANGARALKSLQRGNVVDVTVLRNGKTQAISLSVPP
jgi:general secretion pathway protein C